MTLSMHQNRAAPDGFESVRSRGRW